MDFDLEFQQFLKENDGIYSELLLEFTQKYLIEKDIIGKRKIRIATKDKLNIATIVGVSLDDINYISYQFVEEYQPVLKEVKFVLVYDNNIDNLKNVFKEFPTLNIDRKKTTGYSNEINHHYEVVGVIGTYFVLNKYFIIISLIFILFNFLLSSNFIAVSISYAKKEIGILRAIGARKYDIIKIFGYETFIIGVCSWLLSLVGWYFLITWLNKSLFGKLYFTLNGIITNPLTLTVSLIYIIILSFAITFISISRISKVKPIEAILKK